MKLISNIHIDSMPLSKMNKVDIELYKMIADLKEYVKLKPMTKEKLLSHLVDTIQKANQITIKVQGTEVSSTYGIKNGVEMIELHNLSRKNSLLIDIEMIY